MAPFYINGSTGISGVDGSAATPALQGTDTNTGISFGSDVIIASTGGTEKARLTASGQWLVGTFSSTSIATRESLLQLSSAETAPNQISLLNTAADIYGSSIALAKSRAGAAVQLNDTLGSIIFAGHDSTDINSAGAYISAAVDGAVSNNDLPTRLVFSTTADGASSPTTRMRIGNDGNMSIWNASYLHPITDNVSGLGLSGFRWTSVWAANGTIQTSDKRSKTNVKDSRLGSDFIKSLRPVSYKWIEGGKRDTGERDENNNYVYESVPGTRTHWGFIAQEVKEAVDNAGVDFGGWVLTDKDDSDSQQALRYDQFIAPMTKALQETMAELEVLKAEVAALKAQ